MPAQRLGEPHFEAPSDGREQLILAMAGKRAQKSLDACVSTVYASASRPSPSSARDVSNGCAMV